MATNDLIGWLERAMLNLLRVLVVLDHLQGISNETNELRDIQDSGKWDGQMHEKDHNISCPKLLRSELSNRTASSLKREMQD